jgi:uncharacterized protein (DUF433 family)
MSVLLERITMDPDVVHGRPAVRNTRVRVADVLSLLASGASEAEILDDYPYLESDDVKACLELKARLAVVVTRLALGGSILGRLTTRSLVGGRGN